MYNNKTILAIIPARGGSKGVPGKNIRPLGGKPLIAWTIEAAAQSAYIDRVIVTSDDEMIIRTARQYGAEVPFVRPSELAQDDTPGMLPLLHAIDELPGYDFIVELQPTSPFRTTEDIDGCIELCIGTEAFAVVSVTESDKSPYWMFHFNEQQHLQPIMGHTGAVRRQDLPKVLLLNGAVYVADTNWLLNTKTFLTEETKGFIMPKERSQDIDTLTDFGFCEYLLSVNLK